MAEKLLRSYTILSRVEALIGAIIAISVFSLYGLRPSLLADTGVTLSAAIMGAVVVVYYLTIHQFLGHKQPTISAFIMTGLSVLNIMLIIAQTGGLDSPFYSFWLLGIVAIGIFGRGPILIMLGGTVGFYIYSFVTNSTTSGYATDHVIQMVITLVAGGLAEWVHQRSGTVTAQSNKIQAISGRLSEEQLKADVLMRSIGEGVVVVGATRQIQLFNTAAQTMTGWDESSAQNIDYNLVLKLKTADDKELTPETDPFAEAITQNKTINNNALVMTTQAGRKIPLSLTVSPIADASGTVTGAIALFRDITKEKELERQKDEFVSTASHEMRTPVAAIEGYLSLAMNANVATVDDRAMKFLGKAHDTVKHLGELFRDLLSVTKAEENELVNAKLEATDINALLQSAVDDMAFTAQKKSLSVAFQLSSSGGKALAPTYYVKVNPERLREVVMNLIDNGIKFTPQGGITVSLDGNDKEVVVSVTDTGLGIANEDIGHLFQKFYRIDNTDTRTIGGTGLGLYLCRTVIELFQGRIWVESKPGKGSSFKFSLPRLGGEELKKLLEAQSAEAAKAAVAPAAVPAATAPTDIATASTPVAQPALPAATPIGIPVAAATALQPASGTDAPRSLINISGPDPKPQS